MDRKVFVLVLCAVAAVGAVMLIGTAQADPPETGNWTITAFESYYGKTLRVNGSIFIEDGASLFLTDVDLIIDATDDPQLTMGPGGQFIVEGGTIKSIGSPVVMNLEHGGYINGTKIMDIYGINKWDWGGGVTNCAIVDPLSFGINMAPKGNKLMPTWIFGNTITGSGGRGINVSITSVPPGDMYLYLYGNTIADSRSDGIWVEVVGTEFGSIDMSGNRVERAGGNGFYAWIVMQDLQFDVNDTYIADCSNYGLVISLDVPGHGDDTIDNVTVLNSGTFGVNLEGGSASWDHPTLSRFDVQKSYICGMFLYGIKNAMLVDSNFLNPDVFKGEFSVTDSQLDIYRTEHTFASGSVMGSTSRITSWRYVNLTYTWQNGVPIANGSYRVLDDKGKPIYAGTTDEGGWLGNHTVWDWNLNAVGIQTRSGIRPELSAPPAWLSGPLMNLDRDIDTTVEFVDNDLPELELTFPQDGLVRNTTSMTVNGTCADALSGLRIGMLAFESSTSVRSPWLTWEGSGPWEVVLSGLFEGANRIIVRAYDVANYPNGSYAELTRSVTVDTVQPWVRIVSPVPSGVTPLVTNQDQMPFELEFDSDVLTVVVNGAPSPVTLLGRFSGIIDLVPGDNAIVWTVVDWAGNTNTVQSIWVLDVTPPALTVGLSPGTTYTNVDHLVLAGTTDAEGAVVGVNGADASIVDGEWTCTVDLVEGENAIVVEAVDAAGNTARFASVVVLDTVPPELLIFEPGEGSLINRVPIQVRGAVDSPLLDGVVSVNGVQVAVVGGEFTATVPAPSDGELVITVVGRDLAGNEGAAEVAIVVDTTPPEVTGLSVADGRLTNDPHLLLSGIVEAGSTLRIGGALVDYVGGSFAVALDLVEGRNAVGLESRDVAGNNWSGVINITLDTIAPQLVVDGVVGGRVAFRDGALTITGRTEAGATLLLLIGNASLPLTVDAMGEFSHSLTLTSDSTSLRISALDAAGNVATSDLVAERVVPAPAPKWTGSPVVGAVAAASTVLIVLGVAASVEVSKYALLVLILPLYARIHKHEVLDNKTRYALHGLILENPGLHYNEIIREFGLTNGVAAYHLHVLEREGFLRAVRDGTLKRFYSVTTKVPQDRRMTPDQIRDAIVTLVEKTPGINQREIVDGLGIGRTVVGYHLKALVDEGILESSRFGKFTTYKLKAGRRLL